MRVVPTSCFDLVKERKRERQREIARGAGLGVRRHRKALWLLLTLGDNWGSLANLTLESHPLGINVLREECRCFTESYFPFYHLGIVSCLRVKAKGDMREKNGILLSP